MIVRIATKASCLLLLTMLSFGLEAQLVANFTATTTSGCSPLVVHFTDVSTNQPTQWKWDLGNGTVSYLQNPSATYFNPGQYTIKLIVKNNAGSDSVTKTQFINIYAQPQVEFTSSTTLGCYPLTVHFTDQSTVANGSINSWQWDFGDGYASSLQHPTHVYTTSGNYNVSLIVKNNNNCLSTLSKTQYIQIGSGVKANFSNSNPNNCSFPVTINFQNYSAGSNPLAYIWNFGDGTNSSETNPVHTYANFGTYTVKLIATNTSGCTDTVIKVNAIVVNKIKASFTIADTVCQQQPVVFNNNSTPAPISTYWSFGDGTYSSKINPIKTYDSAGTYQVKLVSNYGDCADSVIKTIIVSAKPVAIFISDAAISCKSPLLVHFTNQSLNAIAYQWNFGDGTQSTTQNPTHAFTGNGSFSVQLIALNANGCSDTILKKDIVAIQKPVVSFTNLPDSGCVSFTKNFTSSIVTIDSVVSYLWNFGDSTTSTVANPTHTFTTAGAYLISVIETTANGCRDTATMYRGIIATTKPIINFSASPKITCAKSLVNFKDLTTTLATKWLWLFGDSTYSSEQNPSHIYNDTGKFTVQLIVWNGGCNDTLTYKDYIQINAPIGKFSFSMDCKKPFERVFTDQSIGADEWNWNFGDGSSSTLKNPIHQYAGPGIYEVSLLVKNYATGCDFVTKKTIQIVDAKASFSTAATTVCKGSNVVLTSNINASDVTSFNWNFGDSTPPATSINSATHIYSRPGNYSIQLTISDVLGCNDTLMKNNYIRVNGPTANFISSIPGACLNTTVSFTDLSVNDGLNPIKLFTWDYADGKTELKSAGPFQHTFSTPGTFKVKLTVVDSKGCSDSFSLPTALVISKPVAAFSTTENISCPTKPVSFTDQSTGPGLTYLWAFGDGSTDVIKNPFHAFTTNGIFTVSLLVKDQYGCRDSISKSNIVSIVTPVANFKISDSVSACPPLIVQVTNLSNNGISNTWDFGDGTSSIANNPSHFYGYPGNYTVTLKATGPGGCSSTYQKAIFIKGPRGTLNYNPIIGCNPVTTKFTASTTEIASLVWDFNDGTTINSTDTATSHEYTHAGNYIPKIILTDNSGCHVPIVGKDTIIVNGIMTGFNFSKKIVCDSATVYFFDSSFSNDLITSYNWSLGDGSKSAVKNPVHQYSVNGLYYPKLVITSKYGCTDSLTAPVPVKVISAPKIKMVTSANGCTPLTMIASGIVTVADTSKLTWKWDFANNHLSTLQNPVAENYTIPGIYTISLMATNSSGCTNTVNTSIEAYSIPLLKVAQDTFVCQHRGTNLEVTGASTYSWSPSTGLNCTNCSSPFANPDSAISYVVKGTSIHGCTALDTVKVIVKYPFKIGYSKQDTLCKGQSKKLYANGTNNYLWTPAAGLNNTTSATPTAQPDTTTNYMVIGTDDKGCFRDTGHVLIRVFPVPEVDAGGNRTVNIGKTLDLLPVISPDVTDVLWSPTTGIFRNSYPGISVKPNSNTDYTVVVKNAGGCSAQDRVTVYVICNGANVFIPNTFSPNGDGINDIFYPRGSGLFKIQILRIFNRWGQVVFEKNSFDANDAAAGWDGTFKGARLNPDVYVYTIDIICDNNSILVYKGNVALIL